MLKWLTLALACLFALLGVTAAGATPPLGSLAWTIRPAVLFDGPGTAYDRRGDVDGAVHVRVTRCQKLWCHINASSGSGWVSKANLNFGTGPHGPFSGPRLAYPSGGPGKVCFYEGANYTGRALCGGPGFVIRDLKLTAFENRFSSVSIEGNVSATLCRDRFFQSHCQRITKSQPRLNGFLANAASSLHVY
jgi:hypothetical protein